MKLYLNFHNKHVWADQDHDGLMELEQQASFSLNVWVNIAGDSYLLSLYRTDLLNGTDYLNFHLNGFHLTQRQQATNVVPI